jgi:hypothetical protein
MTAPVWPTVPNRQCMHCDRRKVTCTWFPDARLLCASCQYMPSRFERFIPALEDPS